MKHCWRAVSTIKSAHAANGADANPADETTTARDTTLMAYRFQAEGARPLDDKSPPSIAPEKSTAAFFSGRGQEALSVSVGVSLKKTDVFAPLIATPPARLAFGETPLDAIGPTSARRSGPCADGRQRPSRQAVGRLFPHDQHLGAMISSSTAPCLPGA